MSKPHSERHYSSRIGWLRAAVLGANDGIVSTASLVVGVAASNASRGEVLIAGVAGLVAGAMSMAAGEFVSVSSQSDTEKADLQREQQELDDDYDFEHKELATIYVTRGVEPLLAGKVAEQMMTHDALAAHARDELGFSATHSARPIQAAFTSASTFVAGALIPVLTAVLSPPSLAIPLVAASSLVCLALTGGLGARAGGADFWVGATRVVLWGALAMVATATVGTLFEGFS